MLGNELLLTGLLLGKLGLLLLELGHILLHLGDNLGVGIGDLVRIERAREEIGKVRGAQNDGEQVRAALLVGGGHTLGDDLLALGDLRLLLLDIGTRLLDLALNGGEIVLHRGELAAGELELHGIGLERGVCVVDALLEHVGRLCECDRRDPGNRERRGE